MGKLTYDLYQDVILKAWNERGSTNQQLGLTRLEVAKKHRSAYGRLLDTIKFRQQILPMLEAAGLVTQERDPRDRRNILIYPIVPSTDSGEVKNNSERGGGVMDK